MEVEEGLVEVEEGMVEEKLVRVRRVKAALGARRTPKA